jgi:hypothetical protein
VEVYLDLRAAREVTGRVEAPEGTNLRLVRVVVEGEELATASENEWDWQPGMRKGHRVRPDGTFRIPVATDRPVTLQPWHPILVPSAEGGAVAVTEETGEVVLRLESGNEASFPVPEGAGWTGFSGHAGVRVALYRGEPFGLPVADFYALIENGRARFGGFDPGTWTVWIDPRSGYAPATLRDVELRAGAQDLPDPGFRVGSSLRIRVLVAEGTSVPRLSASGFREVEPAYYRHMNSDGESEVVLPGFGPGTFRVRYSAFMTERGTVERELVFDGKTDVTVDLDLR